MDEKFKPKLKTSEREKEKTIQTKIQNQIFKIMHILIEYL